ncbi:farnesyl pyrophosphate synthase 1-like [Lolium rigidum]|uniref:farnesyl pyrophosphate synthase 1-like n=1 Tax=Lolium rigidum TaxID=89674 RepID=UPI001F5C1FAD|nr:farnesyl pyrophosphate synthase 1-like [Lolium rigidum]
MAAEEVAPGTTATFRRVYETLKAELLRDSAFDFNEDAVRWLDAMLDYNVLGGKLNRGLAVIESYKLLKAGSEPSEDELFLACILGWGIEWLQAYFLVLDDIMDNSQTRRGKPCWYRVPKVCQVTLVAVLLLKQYFVNGHVQICYYVFLLDSKIKY